MKPVHQYHFDVDLKHMIPYVYIYIHIGLAYGTIMLVIIEVLAKCFKYVESQWTGNAILGKPSKLLSATKCSSLYAKLFFVASRLLV